jgi:DNA repair exonuclease SbcCD ATPase subunit
MKKISIPFLLIVLTATGLFAQKPINITEDSVSYRNVKHPGVVVCIPEVAYEPVQKAWVKILESGTKSKAVYENGEWSIFGARLKTVSETPVNVYSKLAAQDSMVKLMVLVELKKDVYVEKGSAETEMDNLKVMIKQFAKNQYTELAEDQYKAEDKKLRELEKELSSYEGDESKLEKSIRSDEKTIKEEEDNLAVLNNELTNLSAEAITENTQFSQLQEGAAKEEKAKYIKDLEKRKKKVTNDIKSAENQISKANSDIRDANAGIPKSQVLQKEVREKIAIQEAVVRKFEDKLNKIKDY